MKSITIKKILRRDWQDFLECTTTDGRRLCLAVEGNKEIGNTYNIKAACGCVGCPGGDGKTFSTRIDVVTLEEEGKLPVETILQCFKDISKTDDCQIARTELGLADCQFDVIARACRNKWKRFRR